MQVRAGGRAGRADIGNDLALADCAARADAGGKRTQVRVVGFIAVVMPQDDEIAIAAFASGEGNRSIARGLDPRACGCPEVNAGMGAVEAKNGCLRELLKLEVTRENSSGERRKPFSAIRLRACNSLRGRMGRGTGQPGRVCRH